MVNIQRFVLGLTLFQCTTVFTTVLATDDPNKNVLVSLAPGQQLKGLNTTTSSGAALYKFYGVPYAVPPIGELRFHAPRPAPSWTGVKDAVSKSTICHQYTTEDLTSVRSEDCLFLNVFTPDTNASLPVLVWIHGGGYRTGSAYNDGDGATLAPEGIVVVTINYRLGPFGFLSTGDSVMPGNYGMLDQVLALKWVQTHIKTFGGDPNQVTIGGESAGSSSVSLLIVSPLTKGLFKRGILESGSSFSVRAVERPGTVIRNRNSTLRSAARVGCNQSASSDLLKCLQQVDAHLLLNVSQDANTAPRIETTFGFLPDEPTNLLKKGTYNRADTLHGTNSGEGSGAVRDPENDGVTRQEFIDTVRSQFGNNSNTVDIINAVVDGYLGNATDPFAIRAKLVQEVKDNGVGDATLYEISGYVNDPGTTTKHYLYEFDYRMSGTQNPVWRGVEHAAERRFVFYPDSRYNYSTSDDRTVGETVRLMWGNFVKYGDPTPLHTPQVTVNGKALVKWEEFTKTSPKMLTIDSKSTLATYPSLFVVPLYEKLLENAKKDSLSPIVG